VVGWEVSGVATDGFAVVALAVVDDLVGLGATVVYTEVLGRLWEEKGGDREVNRKAEVEVTGAGAVVADREVSLESLTPPNVAVEVVVEGAGPCGE